MQNTTGPFGKQLKKNEPIKLKDIDSSLFVMEKLLDKLRKRAEILPEVSKSGESECSFAETLYSAKESAGKEVVSQLKKLQEFLKPLEEEIARCEKNLSLIEQDSYHLRRIESKEDYSHAGGSFQGHYNQVVRLKKNLINEIARAKSDLRKANAKKWPLGTPRGSAYESSPSFDDTKDVNNHGSFQIAPASSYVNGPLNKEIDSLMALGPLGGPAFR